MLATAVICITGLLVMPDFARAQSKAVKARSAALKPPNAQLQKEINEQTRIYQSRGEQVPSDYVTDRSLLSYAITLLPGFDHSLAKLGPADRWLDIGAGQGRAILDYYGERFDAMHAEGREQRGSKARAVALSIEDRRPRSGSRLRQTSNPGKSNTVSANVCANTLRRNSVVSNWCPMFMAAFPIPRTCRCSWSRCWPCSKSMAVFTLC